MKESVVRNVYDHLDLADQLLEKRNRLFSARTPITGSALMLSHSHLLDETLNGIFEGAVAEVAASPDEKQRVYTRLSLVATGGYGRGELAPFSDVDVSFISSDDDDPVVGAAVKTAYESIVETLNDRLKLKVGYSYRVLGEIENLDLHTRTALLDARCIAGSRAIALDFVKEISETLGAKFVLEHIRSRSKTSDMKPLYSVEPDVKTGMGGLRDFHVAGWVARAVVGGDNSEVWPELVVRGIVPETRMNRLLESVEFIRRTRNALHLTAGKQLDVLPVDRREEISSLLGLSENELLDSYYASAEVVRSVCEHIWSTLADRRLPIEKPFALVGRKIALVDRTAGLSRPGVALRAFALAEEYESPISEELSGQISRFCHTSPPSLAEPENRFWFRALLDGRSGGHMLVSMSDQGLLQKLIPEFAVLMHRAPSDGSHELTIGAHSLLVAKTLDEMRQKRGTLYGDLWAGLAKPAVLYFAALLHDIGKIEESGEHAAVGGEMAESLAKSAGFSTNSAALVRFLVANHQVMADIARTHDLGNGIASDEFASLVGDVTRLRMLFLLCVADMLSVGQVSWAEMQCRFLEELYFETEARLMGDMFVEPERLVKRRKRRLAQDLTLARLPEDIVREHIGVMPADYLLNEQPESVATHVEQVIACRRGKPSVTFDEHPDSRITDMTVCTFDRHGLLSQITGALYALDITVHSAKVRTRVSSDAIAIDTLCMDFLGDRLPYFKRKEVEQCIKDVLSGRCRAEELIKIRGKAFSPGPEIYSVQLTDVPEHDRSVLEVRAEDVPGLLYYITAAITRLGWDILSAKISTAGRTAVDAFTVRTSDDRHLPRTAANKLKKELSSEG